MTPARSHPLQRNTWSRRLAGYQGAYYVVTGVWPLLHLRSFLAVTGPKTDTWLVQTVGALIGVSGAGLILAARRSAIAAEWRWLAAGDALALALVDVVFVAQRRIPPVYLLDAFVEAGLLLGWLWLAFCEKPDGRFRLAR